MCLALTAAAIAGCSQQGTVATDSSGGKITYLCVGMETSLRFGDCPGCEKDAKCMTSILRDRLGYRGNTLISSEASKQSVIEFMEAGIENTPEDGMFVFTYSGHGGQERLGGAEPEGADSPDEYLCLYDTYMQDDEIWDIVKECKGRVFMIFDACHSATMFRSVRAELDAKLSTPAVCYYDKRGNQIPYKEPLPLVSSAGFSFRIPSKKMFVLSSDGTCTEEVANVRVLCWSGCKEAEYSYGSSAGGMLTQAIVKYWKEGMAYETLWEKSRKCVIYAQPGQNPVATNVGGGFAEDAEAFK